METHSLSSLWQSKDLEGVYEVNSSRLGRLDKVTTGKLSDKMELI